MIIKGLIKTTFLDYPGEIACTIFLFGCNMRCGFCHNPDLVKDPSCKQEGSIKYSEEEILEFLEKRKPYLDAICITGGEPLLSLDLNFLRRIKDIKKENNSENNNNNNNINNNNNQSNKNSSHYKIKIDTNGTFPIKLREIIEEGLVDYIAMDIKGSKENYKNIVSFPVDMGKIEESIKLISKFPNYEFRTTFLHKFHNEYEIKKVMEWLSDITGTDQNNKLKNYYLQGFRKGPKLMDNSFFREDEVHEAALTEPKRIASDYFDNVGIRV